MFTLRHLLSVYLIASAFPAQADVSPDTLIAGAKRCTQFLPRYEREYGIPAHLLSAISSTESGRYHKGLKLSLPWPWTINAEGKGYFFDTKEEAMNAAKRLRAQGIKSMDVGCMQVNLVHHSKAFANLEQAFEPQNNVAYAASFLRSLYQESNSWKQAASNYHSRTSALGAKYFGNVYDRWRNLVSKLREARLQIGDTSQMMANAPAKITEPASAPYGSKLQAATPQISKTPVSNQASISRLPEQAGKKLPLQKTVRYNSITMANNTARHRENGVLVIRPEIKFIDSAVAATPSPSQNTFVIAQAESVAQPQVVHLDTLTAANAQMPKKSGPSFIFDQ